MDPDFDPEVEGEDERLKGREKKRKLGVGRMTVRVTVWVGCSKKSVTVTVPGRRGESVGLEDGEDSGKEPMELELDVP